MSLGTTRQPAGLLTVSGSGGGGGGGTSLPLIIVTEGDSITALTSTPNWPTILVTLDYFTGKTVSLYNRAVGGTNLAAASARYAAQVYPLRPAANPGNRCILLTLFGANDVPSLTSDALIASYFTALETYWSNAIADGFEVWALTTLPRSGLEATIEKLNHLVRRSLIPTRIIDTSKTLTDPANPVVFPDGLHPSALGQNTLARTVNTALYANASPLYDLGSMSGQDSYAVNLRGGKLGYDIRQSALVSDPYSGGDWIQIAIQDSSLGGYTNGYDPLTLYVAANSVADNAGSHLIIQVSPTQAFLTTSAFAVLYGSYAIRAISAVRVRNDASAFKWAVDVQIVSGLSAASTRLSVTQDGTAIIGYVQNPSVGSWIQRTLNLEGASGYATAADTTTLGGIIKNQAGRQLAARPEYSEWLFSSGAAQTIGAFGQLTLAPNPVFSDTAGASDAGAKTWTAPCDGILNSTLAIEFTALGAGILDYSTTSFARRHPLAYVTGLNLLNYSDSILITSGTAVKFELYADGFGGTLGTSFARNNLQIAFYPR